MSQPISEELWPPSPKKVAHLPYCAVVFQPSSINELYCLMNENLTILLYDVLHFTAGELVDSYVVGKPKDDFEKVMNEIYDSVTKPISRSTYWRGPAEKSYEETLELWKRLANQVDPRLDLQLTGIDKTIDPSDSIIQNTFGSKILNLSAAPQVKCETQKKTVREELMVRGNTVRTMRFRD